MVERVQPFCDQPGERERIINFIYLVYFLNRISYNDKLTFVHVMYDSIKFAEYHGFGVLFTYILGT